MKYARSKDVLLKIENEMKDSFLMDRKLSKDSFLCNAFYFLSFEVLTKTLSLSNGLPVCLSDSLFVIVVQT